MLLFLSVSLARSLYSAVVLSQKAHRKGCEKEGEMNRNAGRGERREGEEGKGRAVKTTTVG